jgi:dihydrofolate reductase
MGSRTAIDLGRPLADRDNIVITSKDNLHPEFIITRTLEGALKKAKEIKGWNTEIFIIGGSRLFNEVLESNQLSTIFYTHINKSFNCDNFIKPVLHLENMTYKILDKKKAMCVDIINTINTIGEVELTFYSIEPKDNGAL